MKLTEKKLKKYEKIDKEYNELLVEQNAAAIAAKNDHGDKEAEVPDMEGGTMKVKEKDLWREVFHLGTKGNRAADYIREAYPEIMKRQDKLDKMREEKAGFEQETFGFTHDRMTLIHLVKLIKAVVKLCSK